MSRKRWLPIVALAVWVVGVLCVSTAFSSRGQVWLAAPNYNSSSYSFTNPLEESTDAGFFVNAYRDLADISLQAINFITHFIHRQGAASNHHEFDLTNHHTIISPPRVNRLPEVWNNAKRPLKFTAKFKLSPDGTVSDVTILSPSGYRELDAQLPKAIGRWKFGAWPEGFPQYSEIVTVTKHNRWGAVQPSMWLLPLAFMIMWMGGACLFPSSIPSQDNELKISYNLRLLITIVGFLAGLGWLLVWRLSLDINNISLATSQAKFLWLGTITTIVCVVLTRVLLSPEFLYKKRAWFVWVSIFSFLLLFTPLGTSLGQGARQWLKIGPLTLQPVEIAKVFLVFFLAGFVYDVVRLGRPSMEDTKGAIRPTFWYDRNKGAVYGFVLLAIGVSATLDFGPILLMGSVLLAVLYLHELRSFGKETPAIMLKWVGVVVALFFLTWLLVYLIKGHFVPFERIRVLVNPWEATRTAGIRMIQAKEQVTQALWGVTSGGFWGLGLGQGQPDLVRHVESDFAFLTVAEELGFLGGLSVLALFASIIKQGLDLSRKMIDVGLKTLVTGLSLAIAFQAFLTIGGTIGMLPLSGVTLPFLSYGGTSLIISFSTIGVILGIGLIHSDKHIAFRTLDPVQSREFERGVLRWQRLWLPAGVGIIILVLAYRQLIPYNKQREFKIYDSENNLESIAYNPLLTAGGKIRKAHLTRGNILDINKKPLAQSTPQGRRYFHYIADFPFIGARETKIGKIGLEEYLNDPLMGVLPGYASSASGHGYNVQLTIDQPLQSYAFALLKEAKKTGTIVGVDPQTGEIRIAASYPPIDPESDVAANEWLASLDNKEGAVPFALRAIYAPGSTFKTVVAAAALDANIARRNSVYFCNGTYLAPNAHSAMHEEGGVSHGRVTLETALAESCNVTFAKLGTKIGWNRLYNFVCKSGFYHKWKFLPDAWQGDRSDSSWFWSPVGTITPNGNSLEDTSIDQLSADALMRTSIGQQNVRMSSLHMAVWTAAIANGGRLIEPSLVHSVQTQDGTIIWEHKIKENSIMRRSTVRTLQRMMETVVQKGTGRPAHRPGLRIAGKTGTAENASGGTNALFIAFSPDKKPNLAVAIVLENTSGGGINAGPIAANILQMAADRDTN